MAMFADDHLKDVFQFLSSHLSSIAIAVVSIYSCWRLVKWCQQSTSSRRLPPCLPSIPVIGSLPFITTDMNELHKFFVNKTNKYGNIYGLYFGSSYAIVLNGTKAIEDALVKKSSHFADRYPFYIETHYLNPNRKGVVMAAYNAEFRQKHQLYLSILKEFGFGQRTMETRINMEVNELVVQARQLNGGPFDPFSMIGFCIMNIITSILLGQRLPHGHPILVDIKDRMHDGMTSLVYEIDFLPFLRFVPLFRQRMKHLISVQKTLMAAIDRELQRVLIELKACHTEYKESFIYRFIEANAAASQAESDDPLDCNYDREELLYAMRDFFTGGTDTTVTTLRWFLVLMANHPDIQARMQQEVDSVVGRDRLPSLADESDMIYSQAVMLETMRWKTLVPISVFRATLCDTQVGDYFIPANTTVLVNLYSAHMDPETWRDPTVYRPGRFIDDCGQIVGKERIMSFSRGKRSCIGELLARQELFLFMTGIVQNFNIFPPEGQEKIICAEKTVITTEPTPYEVRLIPK